MDSTSALVREDAGGYSAPTPHVRHSDDRAAGRGGPASILFIDPRPLTRECVSRWLAASTRNFRVVSVSTPDDIPNEEALRHRPDLILFNIAGAEVTEGWAAEAIALLRRTMPDVPIAVLSDREEAAHIAEAVRRGVRGYIPTSLPFPAAVEALRFVRAGGTFVPASALEQRVPEKVEVADDGYRGPRGNAGATPSPAPPPCLTRRFTSRELEVLARLRQGQPNKIIAFELNIRDSTVKVHVRHIMKKLKATNRTQVAYLARRLFERHGDDEAPGGDDRQPPEPWSGGVLSGSEGRSGSAAIR